MDNSEHNNRIEEKIDKISEDVVEIKITMARNTESLEQHMARTEIAENNIISLHKELDPLKEHVSKVSGIISFIYASASILAAIATIFGCLKALNLV